MGLGVLLRPILRSAVDAQDVNRMLTDLIHEDIWPAGKHHFAGTCYTAFPAPLCERI
jgi:hypothetical protein